ncbi:hypothetical protein ACH5RR_041081 [Cinchona calisaya]|uniref:RNase H type-1 domain-containing protein n=1 Tax=Cinchona calisaya TaxID=153742 RepID=A0ABD2XYI9_9GENT
MGCGGILKDHLGNHISGFAKYIGVGSNLKVEAQKLLLGLQKCLESHHTHVMIDADSQVPINLLTGAASIPWHLDSITRRIMGLLHQANFQLNHIFREANSVTDKLAKIGSHDPNCNLQFYSNDFTSCIRCLFRMDSRGFPYICSKYIRCF